MRVGCDILRYMPFQCPKCSEVFELEGQFKQHAISVHKAPANLINSAPIDIKLPPGAQMIQPVDPKIVGAEVTSDPSEAYKPVGNVHDRPRVSPKTVTDSVQVVDKPLQLEYLFTGVCPDCRVLVSTMLVTVAKKSIAVALCPQCKQVKKQQEVTPL